MAKLNGKTLTICCFIWLGVLEHVSYTADAEDISVRLRGGPGPNEGRVEVFKNGVWVSLCNTLVSSYVEQTICGQLGFLRDGAQTYSGNSYGPAPGETYRGRVTCNYQCSNLSCCTFGPETSTCDPQYALGISCNTNSSEVQNVRLVGGNSSFEGRVEVFLNGVWGTVTDERPLFSTLAANVICRTIHGKKYGGSVIPKQQSAMRFGFLNNRAIVMQGVRCNGNETNILDCSHSGGGSSWTHEDDLAIVCNEVPEGCNGYVASMRGTIAFPGDPKDSEYNNTVDCIWKVDTFLEYSQIALSFSEVPLTSYILQVFSSSGYSLGHILSPQNMTIDDRQLYIWLQVRAGTKGNTFNATWDIGCSFSYSFSDSTYSITSPGYGGPYPENLTCTYVITYRKGLTTSISFNTLGLSIMNGSCTDYVQIFGGGSEMSPTIGGPYCGTTLPAPVNLTNSNFSSVTIVFRSDGISNASARETGFQIYFRSYEPAAISLGPYNASSGTLSTPGYPNVYNGEEDIEWTITTKPYNTITLFFQDLQLESSLYVSSYGTIYSSGRVSPIVLSTNSVSLRLPSTYNNGVNKVLFNWTTECRQVISSSQGTISSPNDPDFDSSSAYCSYVMSYTQGYYISLLFSAVTLARDTQCLNSIKVFDGANKYSSPIGHLCSSSPPSKPINSSENVAMVEFSTNGLKGTNNSFKASFSTHSKECGNWLLTESEGVLESPGYPLLFPANTYCNWTITVNEGFTILFTFKDFNVGQQGAVCNYALVKVYDGNTTDPEKVIGTYCGTQLVPTIHSSGNSLTVVLNAFSSAYNGFRASYRQVKDLNTSLDLLKCDPRSNSADPGVCDTRELQIEDTFDEGFPFGDIARHKIYVGKNGIVSFDYNYTWPVLEPTSLAICVYCAYMKPSSVCRTGTSGVYYKKFSGNLPEGFDGIMKELGRFLEGFSPSLVIVVTWKCMEQDFQSYVADSSTPDKPTQATFQLILASNETTSYAFTLYSLTEMNWKYYGTWYPIHIGVTRGSEENILQNAYSNSRDAYNIATFPGNTDHKGIWYEKIGEIARSPGLVCREWYLRNKKLRAVRNKGFDKLPRCPCKRDGIYHGVANQWRYFRRDEQKHLDCFILNLATTRRYAPLSRECCYQDREDQLVTAIPTAGPSLAYTPLLYHLRDHYETEDVQAYRACCFESDFSNQQCKQFYDLRPIAECESNVAYQRSTMYGDPHIKTLDEREYNYNGVGEIVLITISTPEVNFTLQGRTERTWDDKGVPSNGTVFTALGMEENGVKVFVGIDPSTNTSLVIYGNETDYTRDFQDGGDFNFTVDTEAFMITRANGTCIVSFPSGIGIQVSVRLQALSVGFSIPITFRNLTKGMLGNFNGNNSDDFILPSGEILSNNLSESEIFYNFSQKWLVTDRNMSVMHYEPKMGPSDYSHPEFIPVFLDEAHTTDQSNAVKACGADNKPCIYDYIATGKQDFALETSSLRNQSETILRQIKNSLPVISTPQNVTVKQNQTTQFTVRARDADDDEVTIHLVEEHSNVLKINSSNGMVTVSLTTFESIQISVYAVDSQGGRSPSTSVPLIVCSGCSGHGKCNEAKTRQSTGTFYFRYAICECQPAWTGDDCQLDKDGCAVNPCHPLQNCTDIAAEKQGNSDIGYNCSTCPQGFVNNGLTSCSDVNECNDKSFHHCEMLCENTYGSYLCYCQQGYRLNNDNRTCSDINECTEHSDDCPQTCLNIDGGYRCACEEGYIYDEATKKCNKDLSVQDVCQSSSCSQNCRVKQDPSINSSIPECFCDSGYELDSKDNQTCKDHDECNDSICTQVCTNTDGSFSCSCNRGYTLNDDGRTCSPCPHLHYGVGCHEVCRCSGRGKDCDKVRGCICQDGWTGSQCQDDIDECAGNSSICGQERICINNLGSYTCLCRLGYQDDGQGNCTDVNECTAKFPCEELEECYNTPGSYYCSCIKGYMKVGDHCTDVDECQSKRAGCQHLCINVPGSFNCQCRYGYQLQTDRKKCVQVQDVCSAFNMTICSHGCTLDEYDNPVCICDIGFDLTPDHKNCTDIDECTLGQFNCSHTCNNTIGGFVCSCPLGMKLDQDDRTCTNCTPGTYGEGCAHECACGAGSDHCDVRTGCVCKDGWTGDKCTQDINECQNNSTMQQCAGEKKVCVNIPGSYRCECPRGFFEDVNHTCTDIDECEKNSCDQDCKNTIGSYQCGCRAGFVLNQTTNRCNDVDECSDHNVSRCSQECHNTPGSYRCTCKNSGYSLDNDGVTCTDINECNNGLARCTDICNNTDGGYVCSCPTGKKLDADGKTCKTCPNGTYGENCTHTCHCGRGTERCDNIIGCVCRPGWQGTDCDTDIDECLNSTCSQECHNTNGSYNCTCYSGYQFNTTLQDCEDIDECLSSPCSQECLNTNGSYTCPCNSGYQLNTTLNDCEDVNECLSSPCSQECHNTNGSYTCTCYSGYQFNTTLQDCEDIDECLNSTCSQGCLNTNGSYRCTCKSGYQFNTTLKDCEDINECTNGLARCTGICNNTDGEYVCSCPAGEMLDVDRETCKACPNGTYGENCTQTCNCGQGAERCDKEIGCVCRPGWQGNTCDADTDECNNQDVTDNCTLTHAVCVNSPGGYKCECHVGFSRDQFGVCQDIDECLSSHCSQGCLNTNGSYRCTCHSGFQFNTTIKDCEDINECLNSPCSQGCVNTKGSYTCTCYSGFKINSATKDCEDVDECLNSPCSQLCTNIEGDYYCSCSSGYMLVENGKCEAITSIALTISINIVVNVSDLVNEKSNEYQKWNESVTSSLTQYFSTNVVGFISFVVTKLRAGSVIADCLVTAKSSSVGSLTVAMLHLTGSPLTINNQTGDVQVAVQQKLAQSKSKCELFELISPCGEGTECDSTAEVPICRTVENSRSWVLITSLAVGIPAGICLVLIVSCCLVRHKRKTSKRAENNTSTEEIPRSRSSSQAHAYDTLQPAFSTIPRVRLT